MFGQGNPAPRPGVSFQQLPLSAPQPVQQGGQGTGRPVMQHLGNQSGSSFYQTSPMPSHPHVQQVPQSGVANTGLYVHAPHPHRGSNQISYQYPPGPQNSQHHPQLGVQTFYHAPPPRSNLPLPLPPPPPLPPSSHGFQHSENFKPPPFANIYQGGQLAQPTSHQGFPHIQPPPPPPPSASASHIIASCESSSQSTLNASHLVFVNPPPPPPSLLSSPPSPPPSGSGQSKSEANEIIRAAVITASKSPLVPPRSNGGTDPFSMNGGHADAEPTFTSRNVDTSENVDRFYNEGEANASMVEGSLAKDIKSEISRPETGSASQLNSSTSAAGLCSTGDSDMDMEDDITNLVEDLETNDSPNDHCLENLTQTEELNVKEQLHRQIPSPTSSSGMPGEGVLCGDLLGQPCGRERSIKLLQGSASDDATEKPCSNIVNDVLHSLPAVAQFGLLKEVGELNPSRDGGSENKFPTDRESKRVFSEHSVLQNSVTAEAEMDLKRIFVTSVIGKSANQCITEGSKELLCDNSLHSSQVNDSLKLGDSVGVKSGKEDPTASVHLKFDEFGRLARDVSSDSDSDDLRHSRRRGKRGRSRSISPFDRRRRRTPPGRRNKWSRSRSRSPKRRSRSRSPGYRHPSESITERRRRYKSQSSVCFSFQDGRCRRGASCRFLHHDSDRIGSSNRYKSNECASETANGSNFLERCKGSLGEIRSHGDDKAKSHGSRRLYSSVSKQSDAGRDNNVTDKNEAGYGITVVEHTLTEQNGRGETAQVTEASVAQVARDQYVTNLPSNDGYQKSAQTCHLYDASSLQPPVNSSAAFSSKEPSGANHSAVAPQYAGVQPQKLNVAYGSISAHHQGSGTSYQLTTGEPQLNNISSSSQSYGTMSLRSQPVPSENPSLQMPSSVNVSQFSQATNAQYMPQLQINLSSVQPSMGLPTPFTTLGGPSYNQYSVPNRPHQSNIQTNFLWNPLPPPVPQPFIYPNIQNTNTSTSGNTIPSRFEQNQQPPRTGVAIQNISGPYPGHLHYNSQYGRNDHELALPSQRPNSYIIGSSQNQQIEGLGRNDQTSKSYQGLISSTFHVQPSTSLIGPPAMKTLPSSDTAYKVSSQNDKVLKDTSLECSRSHVADGFTGMPGTIESNSLRTSSANLDVPGISEFERTRTLVHSNPYASTFDCPSTSMSSKPQMGGQCVERHGFRETSPSTSSVKNAGQNFPGSVGGQYDPLLDSIDKSSNSLVNSERTKKQRCTGDSDNMMLSVSGKPLDVEETNRKKESEAIASLTSSENDEFGETADAEVGVVENESFSNPVDMPNRDSGVAISETYPDKKSKDSRSMKLFKCAIANFVKEVLKPSWRQGNMSKEAFKTIVKKTVEKVSGAMKGHRYPKSQAKINHYIDSSQRKLTRLVMGYVDKYVKA